MVELSENDGPNQQRGNKRQWYKLDNEFSNAGDNNEGGRNPRGDQGGKFQRRNFGDRGPFNKGGDRPFNNGNRFNRGGAFNKDNNFNRGRNQNFGQGRDNQNFNRGRNNQNFRGRNNQNFRRGGFQNNRFNKSWEGNGNDNAPDFEQNDSVTKHKKFDEENEIEEASNTVNAHPKNKKSKNTKQNVEQNEDEASSSESDQEVETSVQKNQKAKENEEEEEETSSESEDDDETSSESEEEIETVSSKTVQKVHKNEEEEISSSEDEEETVTNSNNVQNNRNKDEEDKESKDKIEANDNEEQQMEIATNEDNTNTEKQNEKTEINSKKSRTVYVGSLPVSVTEQQIKKFFKKYGKIEYIKFRVTKDEYAGVNIIFEKIEDAEKAEEVNGMMYKNHRLSVFFCKGRRTKDRRTSVFAREIPSGFTLTDIWDAFESKYGPVRDIVLPISKSGHFKPTGYAFIDFQAADSKELAITDKQITIKGKIIKVAEYQEQERPDRTPRVHTEQIKKFKPRRTGGPRHSNGPRRFSGGPRNFAGS